MASTNVNTGSGYVGAVNVPVAQDTIATEQYQIVKLDVGALGSTVPFSTLVNTEDAVATANPVGLIPILVADSTPGLEVADGDNVAQRATRYGAAYTQIVTSSGAFVDTFGGGTQYTEGDTDASITGTALMLEGAANTLVAAPGTAADGLLVNLGSNNDVTVTSGSITVANSSGASAVNIQDGGNSITVDGTVAISGTVTVGAHAVTNAGTFVVQENGAALTALQLIDDSVATVASAITTKGLAAVGTDGTNARIIKTDTNGELQVDILSIAAGNNNIGDVDVASLPALPTGTNTIGSVKLTDGTTVATVRELGTNDALNVAITDGSGNQITSFGGGTQYTEDAAAAADPVGTAPILVRKDTPGTITSTDGDNIAQRGTNYGAAYVQVVSSTGSYIDTFGGGTQYTEDAVAATDPVGNAQILVADSTPGLEVADGDNVARRGTRYGAAYSQIVTSTGSFVDSFGGGSQYAEDSAHASGDIGTMALGVRTDTPASLAGTTGDYVPLQMNSTGHARVEQATTIFHNETTSNQTNATTLTGTTRDTGFAAGTICPWNYFNWTVYNSHASTIWIEMSNDNSTWRRATVNVSVLADSVQTLSVPVVTRYYRGMNLQGGSTSTGFMANSSFTVN